MKKRKALIGIDVGGTFVKAAVVDHDTWEIIGELEGIKTDESVGVVGSGALCGM